jgi:DNA-binding beta-propeller fold protein YncE
MVVKLPAGFHCLLIGLLIILGALSAFAQESSARSTPAAPGRSGEQALQPRPDTDKGTITGCGHSGVVAIIASDPMADCDPLTGSQNNSIAVIDPITQTVSRQWLDCELGSNGGGLFDVVVTRDCVGLVSNFGDGTIHAFDFSNPEKPLYIKPIYVGFFAEDIALTPDGKYALVTDGGFSETIAVIKLDTLTHRGVWNTPGRYHNAIAVAPDSQTVLTADYFSAVVNVLRIGEGGSLSFVESIPVAYGHRPVNIAISHDGRTAIAANAVGGNPDTIPPTAPDLDVFRIDGPGQVVHSDIIRMPYNVTGVQSVVFASNHRAYINSGRWFDWDEPEPYNLGFIASADILGPGQAVNTGIEIQTGIERGTSQLFGVDTIAVDSSGRYLYVANPTVSGATPYIVVIDVQTDTIVKEILLPFSIDPNYPFLPTGIGFRQPVSPLGKVEVQ